MLEFFYPTSPRSSAVPYRRRTMRRRRAGGWERPGSAVTRLGRRGVQGPKTDQRGAAPSLAVEARSLIRPVEPWHPAQSVGFYVK